jgi:branched-chain amino acid transport system substrate-binding protein
VYPFSGSQAVVGQEIRQGIELAVQVINSPYPDLNIPLAAGTGLPALGGMPVQVIFADHQSTTAGAREQTNALITQQQVVALLGSYQSEETRVASEVAEQAGIPFLNPDSSSPATGFRASAEDSCSVSGCSR